MMSRLRNRLTSSAASLAGYFLIATTLPYEADISAQAMPLQPVFAATRLIDTGLEIVKGDHYIACMEGVLEHPLIQQDLKTARLRDTYDRNMDILTVHTNTRWGCILNSSGVLQRLESQP